MNCDVNDGQIEYFGKRSFWLPQGLNFIKICSDSVANITTSNGKFGENVKQMTIIMDNKAKDLFSYHVVLDGSGVFSHSVHTDPDEHQNELIGLIFAVLITLTCLSLIICVRCNGHTNERNKQEWQVLSDDNSV